MTFLQLMVPYRGFNTWLRPRSTVRPLGPRSSSSSAVTVRLVSAWPEPSNYLWKTTFEIYQMVYSQNSFNCLFKCYQLVTQTIEILLASLRLCLFVQIWHIYTHLSFRITSTIIIAHWPTGQLRSWREVARSVSFSAVFKGHFLVTDRWSQVPLGKNPATSG